MSVVKKSVKEFIDHIHWYSDRLEKEEDRRYYFDAKDDLCRVLLHYKSVRLRDIKHHFENLLNYHLDFERLQIESWVTFLISCSGVLVFKWDLDKEEVYLCANVEELRNQLPAIKQPLQGLLDNTEPSADSENLIIMSCMEVFQQGYLVMAEGCPMQDPRIPTQDLGVAAKAALSAAAKSIKQKMQISKPVETIESTGPLESTKTGSLLEMFNTI